MGESNKEGQIKVWKALQKGGRGSFRNEMFSHRLQKFNTNVKLC